MSGLGLSAGVNVCKTTWLSRVAHEFEHWSASQDDTPQSARFFFTNMIVYRQEESRLKFDKALSSLNICARLRFQKA